MAASRKKLPKAPTTLLEDARYGDGPKREAAARALAETNPVGACAAIRAALNDMKRKGPGRKAIARSLHWVADGDAARMLFDSEEFDFLPERLRPDTLRVLYNDLRAEIAGGEWTTDPRPRLTRLGLLKDTLTFPAATNLVAWSESLLDLFLAIVDEPRLIASRADAARGIRQLNLRRGHEALLARWESEPRPERALDAYAAWARLGCPVNEDHRADRMMRLYSSLLEELRQPRVADKSDFDSLFVLSVPVVPEVIVSDFFLAVSNNTRFAQTTTALAKRLVDVTRGVGRLVALLDDSRFEACHAFAAMVLADSIEGARAILVRGDRMSRVALTKALARVGPREACDFVAPRLGAGGDWYAAIIAEPTILRDPTWIKLAKSTPTLEDKGRALFLAIARDPQNDSRARAVAALSQAAEQATDRLERRAALYALGQTGHPDATPALVRALDDPEIGDAVPLVCTALGECGDTRAIKILETRVDGRHGSFVRAALEFIRARMTRIHADVLLAACQDDDAVIAGLAQRARDGDEDSAIVLEDALRERGRL